MLKGMIQEKVGNSEDYEVSVYSGEESALSYLTDEFDIL